MGEWVRDHSQRWMTPGGTPLYVCSECLKGSHLYGIEFFRKVDICPDCGSKNTYTDKIWDGKEIN